MPTIFIPPQMRDLTGGVGEIQVDAATVRQAITALEERFPGIESRLCSDGELAAGLQVSVDQRMTSRGIRTPLSPGSEVHFLPAFGGG